MQRVVWLRGWRRAFGVVVLCAAAAACAPSGDPLDAGSDDAGSDSDEFYAGIERTSAEGRFLVRITDAEPAPPGRGDNTWWLSIETDGGAALAGATVEARPFMPEHGHGTSPPAFEATELETAGEYVVGPFDLFMPSLWEVVIVVTTPEWTDEATFAFDIEG